MPSPLIRVLLVTLLLPAVSHADNSNSFTDPFSPFNPNSFAAQNRNQQQLALVKYRQTWWDRFRQRLDATWKAPAGTRFFARLFRRPAEEEWRQAEEGKRKRSLADIFTRFGRTNHVAYNTIIMRPGQVMVVDKVSRTSPFDNSPFGKEVQRAVTNTRVGYWDARGGRLMSRVAQKVKQLFQQGAHRARRWYDAERRPNRPAANDGMRRRTVQGQRELLQHQQLERQRRMSENPNRKIPVWRVQKR